MLFNLNQKRSAGIPVTPEVHRLIGRGNVARDRQEWAAAAAAYGAALDADPSLRHIWIQLGHMQKEAGRVSEATTAYEKAFALRADDPQPLVQIAHMLKVQGDSRAATRYFLRAIRANDGDAESLSELAGMMRRVAKIDPASLYRAARHADGASSSPAVDSVAASLAIERLLTRQSEIGANDSAILQSAHAMMERIGAEQKAGLQGDRPGIVFDVTDLIAHFRHQRLPTGIQRVQIEVVMRALYDPALDVRICCFVDGRDSLLDIPRSLFMELAAMATAEKNSHAPDWMTLIARVFIHLMLVDPFAFRNGDRLVNLGTSWWVYNYFLLVRNAKRDFGITYIPFVHDFIPIMAADHCVTGVIEDYVNWLIGVFDHADFFLVNSQSTGRDLVRVAGRLGYSVDSRMVDVVTLDADFRQPLERDLSTSELDRWNLAGKDFCLFVSTIESRKNHVLALEAWARLIDLHGDDAIPMLVCVGRVGWLNVEFFERLDRNPRLRKHVTVIERASDGELALLYRSCRFTLYPSHYEGWGLPVTESLCYGKVPVVADNSSLREAGGEFSVFFESNSIIDLVAALESILFESGYRERLEQDIAARFRPRSWALIAKQMTRSIAAVGKRDKSPIAPRALLGRYYPVSLHKGSRIWRGIGSGEVFRAGNGWLWPEPEGSRTAAAGGQLLIWVGEAQQPLRLYIRLRGLDSVGAAFLVSAGGQTVASGNLEAGEERWVLGNIPMTDGLVSVHVRGGSTEQVEMEHGGTRKQVHASISVIGFLLLDQADEASRMTFIESAALGGLEDINAYADPFHHMEKMVAV